jgi:phosphoadenylyl-sulfate reductase (thioredoxin)
MPLLKAGVVVADPWRKIGADAPIPDHAPAIISLKRWRDERAALQGRKAPLGILLDSNESIADIAGDLDQFGVVALNFPSFGDGRPFSQARLLRERYGYKGEVRATGEVLRDQLLFMHRCGFDAYEIHGPNATAGWDKAIDEFSVVYQPAGDQRPSAWQLRAAAIKAHGLTARYGELQGQELLRPIIGQVFPGRIALVSSFGAEAAVLLHMVAAVDPATPVIFLDTGKLFDETLRYRDQLIAKLGLQDARSVKPDPERLQELDADGSLWRRDPDRCCGLRKTEPLQQALRGFEAWITGRKRFHGAERSDVPLIEAADGKIKINPLAAWSAEEVANYAAAHDLPAHPLVEEGYLSIGCIPCSARAEPGENVRAGRWRGSDKTECGIHQPAIGSAKKGIR